MSRYCAECKAKSNAAEQVRREKAARAGICTLCLKAPASSSRRTRCAPCREKGRAAAQKIRVARFEAWLCADCDAPRLSERTRCAACAVKAVEKGATLQQERIAAGLCRIAGCVNRLADGRTMCSACLRDLREVGGARPAQRRRKPL